MAVHFADLVEHAVDAFPDRVAVCKLRTAPVTISYRYTGAELRYMFKDADLMALVSARVRGRL
jgi:hypothetical protein